MSEREARDLLAFHKKNGILIQVEVGLVNNIAIVSTTT